MTLAELIDIECQVLKDNDIDPSELRRRDRKIGQELKSQKSTRHDLFIAWLKRVRTNGYNSPGQLLEAGYRWLGRSLLLCGLITGGGAAASVLSYDGSKPVNVVNFLAVFIGAQLLTIMFFLFNLLPRSIKKLIPGSGEFYNFIREFGYYFSRLVGKILDHLSAKPLHKLWTDLQRLKIRQKLYESVEKWLVIGLTQRFGLIFNIGVLATCLYLITFSDLAFAWNTTLDISTVSFHKAIRFIALPWSTIIPDGVPSLELVEASRYFRLDAEYVGTPNDITIPKAIIVGRWWLFLVLSLIFYGLIPRIVIFVLAKLKLKTAIARLPLKSADFESLYDRLTHPLFETRSLEQEEISPEHKYMIDSKSDFILEGKWCMVIKRGDLEMADAELSELIKRRFGWKVKKKFAAGSLDYDLTDDATFKSFQNEKEKDPILVLVESWEAPDAAIMHFLKQLRKTISISRHIVIGLINTNSKQDRIPPLMVEWHIWKNKISELADPYLRIESMVEEKDVYRSS